MITYCDSLQISFKMWSSLSASVLYILSYLINDTKFPGAPVDELEMIKPSQVQCNSGCHLPGKSILDVDSIICTREPKDIDENVAKVMIGRQEYRCHVNLELPPNVVFFLNSFDCKFSDENSRFMIEDSCSATYSFVEVVEENKSSRLYDSLLWILLTVILVLLCCLAVKEYLKKEDLKWEPPSVDEAVNDANANKEAFEAVREKFESGRDEKRFVQGHSMLNDRRRCRSRSRRR